MSHRPHFHQLPGPASFPLMFKKGHAIRKGQDEGYNKPRMQEKEWQKEETQEPLKGRKEQHAPSWEAQKLPPGIRRLAIFTALPSAASRTELGAAYVPKRHLVNERTKLAVHALAF